MSYVVEGILFGLMLGVMLGPIFIALTQTSIEKGAVAGLLVGLGIWISDVIIVVLSYSFIQSISETVESNDFRLYFGLSGGLILIIFGIGAFIKSIDLDIQKKKHSYRNMIGFWLKGFLVNTINPFTFVFWLGLISTYLIGRKASTQEAWLFLSSIIITIVIANSLLVFGAKAIRKNLTKKHIYWFSKLSGIGLVLCGLYMIWKVV